MDQINPELFKQIVEASYEVDESLLRSIRCDSLQPRMDAVAKLTGEERALFHVALWERFQVHFGGKWNPHDGTRATEFFVSFVRKLGVGTALPRQLLARRKELIEASKTVIPAYFSGSFEQNTREPDFIHFDLIARNIPYRLSINFGSRYEQFSYELMARCESSSKRTNLEMILGLGVGSWDSVERGKEEEAFLIVSRCAEKCARVMIDTGAWRVSPTSESK